MNSRQSSDIKISSQTSINLQIDRVMVNLLSDIKHNLPASQRKNIQVSSPTIGETLIELHQSSDDNNIKRLTSAFLRRAGKQWFERLK